MQSQITGVLQEFEGLGSAISNHYLILLPSFPCFSVPSLILLPKGPFRTKNTTTIAKNSELLRRSVFTTPPRLTTPQTLLGEGKRLQFPGKWCPHKVRRDSKSQGDSKNTTRSKFPWGSSDLILKIRSYLLDPILFSHFPASANIRSDLKNKIAGASGLLPVVLLVRRGLLGSFLSIICNRQEASITWCHLFWPKFGQKMPKFISLHDVLEPLKQALLASRDVKISSQICGSNLQKVFTLGDGCWLPMQVERFSQDTQPPLTPRQGLDYRGRVPDASP